MVGYYPTSFLAGVPAGRVQCPWPAARLGPAQRLELFINNIIQVPTWPGLFKKWQRLSNSPAHLRGIYSPYSRTYYATQYYYSIELFYRESSVPVGTVTISLKKV